MPARHIFHVLLLVTDPDLAELYRHECPECVVTVAKDAAEAIRKAPKRSYSAVIMESRKDWMNEVKTLDEVLDPSPQMVLVGTRSFTAGLGECEGPLERACREISLETASDFGAR